jgi:hypothetical protein
MNKNFKLFFVGSDFYHFNTARKLFLGNNYEIEFYNLTEHSKPEIQNYDLVLFDLNSPINIDAFFSTTDIVNQAHIIFIYSKDTPEKELQKVKSIKSYGYLPIDVSDFVFDITVNKAIEQSNQKQTEIKISNKLKGLNSIYELLLQISTLYLGKSHIDDTGKVQKSLELIGLFVNADRSYIFIYDWDNETCSNTHEWCNSGISSEIENLQNIPTNLIPDWVNTHKKGEPLIIENVQALDDESELKKILAPQSIRSLITVPIFNDEKCNGFVGFDYVYHYSDISEKEYEVLTMYSKILNSLETRKRYEKELINTNNELETKVKLSAEELLKKEIKHSLALQQHIIDLEEILFTLSHKFRHSVAKIMGLSDLLDVTTNSIDEVYEIVSFIKKSTETLDSFTYELTQLAHERKNNKIL